MKERPILFTDEMVRATLQGIKTQTRRLNGLNEINKAPDEWKLTSTSIDYERECVVAHFFWQKDGRVMLRDIRCPFGMPGTPLWGREAWAFHKQAIGAATDEDGPFVYRADPFSKQMRLCDKWTPSIHMPRWAARLLLENTEVRIERVQAISKADADAEGVELVRVSESDYRYKHYLSNDSDITCGTAIESYTSLWQSINGDGSWEANPWVWVIGCKRNEKGGAL